MRVIKEKDFENVLNREQNEEDIEITNEIIEDDKFIEGNNAFSTSFIISE